MTIYVAKMKLLISLTGKARLICAFVFAYSESRYPHDMTHLVNSNNINEPRHEKTRFLHMRKQRRRSASR